MGFLRRLLPDRKCWCGSGKAEKFCSHREAAATAAGEVRNGRRISSSHAGTRRSTGAVTPAKRSKSRRSR